MHIFAKAFVIFLCVILATPVKADDFVSFVEHNFPYEEVDATYGAANIDDGRCRKGLPFSVSESRYRTTNEMNLAKQVHERLRSMGANGFVIIDLKKATLVTRIKVLPLTCALS